jgi:hypothetical protein
MQNTEKWEYLYRKTGEQLGGTIRLSLNHHVSNHT